MEVCVFCLALHCPVLPSLCAGSAKPGKHYEDVSGTLEFKKGDIKKSIDVPVTQQGTHKAHPNSTEHPVHAKSTCAEIMLTQRSQL